jgi:NitT/TauT family transport system ATP-binding protein
VSRSSASQTKFTPEAESGEARVAFRDVFHTFPDGTEVLRDINLSVKKGEFVAVIGPSGCGKSTLLRLASGLLKASTGEVHCDRDGIGFVFQEPTLLPFRTALGNAELFAEFEGRSKEERRRLAMDALERVGLIGFENKYPKTLSGGMKMRASLARSLVLRPSLFLLDEPFAAVDEITRQRLNDDLIGLFSRDRFAVMFITHSVAEACYLAERVIVMSRRPASIIGEVELPFTYPRSPELRFQPDFIARSREVSARLSESGA